MVEAPVRRRARKLEDCQATDWYTMQVRGDTAVRFGAWITKFELSMAKVFSLIKVSGKPASGSLVSSTPLERAGIMEQKLPSKMDRHLRLRAFAPLPAVQLRTR